MNRTKGMSDLRMYELEDIAWDEFDQIGDHMVPNHNNEHRGEPAYHEDNFKPRHEVVAIPNNAIDRTTKYMNHEEDGTIQPLENKRTKLLEDDSSPHSAEGFIPDSRDSGSSRVTSTVSSDNLRVPGHCLNNYNIDTMGAEFCADDTIAGEGCAGNDTYSYPYSLGDTSQTENDLSFLDNDIEDNKSTSLLYNGWPNIENFDDVDRMLRSCDSTFGFGSGKEEDLAWLSSSHNIEECDGMLKSDFKASCPELSPFKSITEHDLCELNNANSSANDSNKGSSYISYKSGFQGSETGEADALNNLNFMNRSAISDRKGDFTPKEQVFEFHGAVHFNNSTANPININGHRKKQASRPNLSEGNRKDRYKSRQVLAHPEHQIHKKNIAPNSFGHLQTPIPYMHLNYIHPSGQISAGSQSSGMKSEINSLTCASPRESSYASNQARSVESSHCQPLIAPVMSVEEKLEKLRRRQGFYQSSVSKQVPYSQNGAVSHSGVANVTNSSNVRDTSCMSSGFNEISLEASTFRQLQQVMVQLDTRTKLCIRDSLYRLARSAEKRHRYANMEGGGPRNRETGDAFIAEGSNNGYIDMETDTNPIDRSVAHLLFHRPSDPSALPAHDGSSLKSHTMIYGSISPTMIAEQLVCQEEAASEAEKNVMITDDG